MTELSKDARDRLYRQLIRLGDMMGDGLHNEPDGKWIEKEYRQTAKALGLIPPAKRNVSGINEGMAKALESASCGKCQSKLKQTRSGSMRAKCINDACGAVYQFKSQKRKK